MTADSKAPGAAERATLRALFGRIGRAALANKGLIAAIFLTAFLEASFTKAPLVLIKPLLDTFAGYDLKPDDASKPPDVVTEPGATEPGTAVLPQEELGDRFRVSFVEFAVDLSTTLGIEFDKEAEQKSVILACALLAALSGTLGAVFIYFSMFLTRYFATKIVVDLRNEIAGHILQLPLRFFNRARMGELISNLTNNTAILSRSFTLVSDHVVADPLLIAGNVVILALFAPEVLPFFAVFVPLMALPMIRLGRKVHKRSGQSMEAMGDATESMNQMLSGIKTVKAFQLEPQRLHEFAQSNRLYLDRTKRMLQAKGRSQAMVFAGYQIAFAAFVVVLGWLMLTQRRSIGDVGMVIMPIATTYTHVKRLARVYNLMMESLGAMDGVEAILREVPDAAVHDRGKVLDEIEGRVAMDSMSFAYGDEPVLRDVSFDIPAGTTVALVGPSGAGKSTLIDLIARFHDPTAGRVLIDGHDLKGLDLRSYRRHIAMVVQQPFLFNTTIEENIRYGRPGATRAEIEQAARAAQIHDFVTGLPRGYDTIVGERGGNLSGGEMQRVTIARAIVRDPAILFLDEATSALDSENEEAVQRALTNLRRGRTSFVIAHRLSTIRDADIILVLNEGRVVEQGKHQQLIEGGGLYLRMIELQQMA